MLISALLLLSHVVHAFAYPAHPPPVPVVYQPRQLANDSQVPFSSGPPIRTLDQLYQGNQKFIDRTRVQAEAIADQAPSFMFLGCVDNRLNPSTIFGAPPGSLITHNNIANRYDDADSSAEAAIGYAIQSLQVQHIIVLGHYGCKGVQTAITMDDKSSDLVKTWVKPISEAYKVSRRDEVVRLRDSRKPQRGHPEGIKTPPPTTDAGFKALVEDNVKASVQELRTHSILTKAFNKDIKTDKDEEIDVFVHGFVYDETTGEVKDLHVSFGPPGKEIPHIPFQAIAAAKNYHRESYRPGVFKGKKWDFDHPKW